MFETACQATQETKGAVSPLGACTTTKFETFIDKKSLIVTYSKLMTIIIVYSKLELNPKSKP